SLRRLIGYLPRQRDRKAAESHIELAGNECQYGGRHIADDCILDAVEIRPTRIPVIGVAHQLDRLIRLKFYKFEGAGADRMLAHVARRDMAGVDRRKPGGGETQKSGLRPLHHKGGLVVAVGGDLLEIAVPGLAGIDAKLLGRFALQEVPGAFDVASGEQLAVVPPDALAQLESQPGAVFVPRPAL